MVAILVVFAWVLGYTIGIAFEAQTKSEICDWFNQSISELEVFESQDAARDVYGLCIT